MGVPLIPQTAPFSTAQRAWLNGYFASLFGAGEPIPLGDQPASAPTMTVSVCFASQTGTAECCAKLLVKALKSKGHLAQVVDLDGFTPAQLSLTGIALFIASTHGEGEFPENAQAFWKELSATSAPALENLSYSVLALGDTNYGATFCAAGKLLDSRLAELGATRLSTRVDCDVDYDEPFAEWQEGVLQAIASQSPTSAAPPPADEKLPAQPAFEPVAVRGPLFNRKHPLATRVLVNRNLNGPTSAKQTHHVVIALDGADLTYEAGDALGIMPSNCPALVNELLDTVSCTGAEPVTLESGDTVPFRRAMARSYDLGTIPKQLLEAIAERAGKPSFKALLNGSAPPDLATYTYGRDVIDVLRQFPESRFSPQELTELLRTMQPRLYSISSSPKAHPGEVHLTVGVVRYESLSRQRKGVCSTFLADRLDLTTAVPVHVNANHAFRLPKDPDTPVIMIGPGTGIAPFRAFLEERQVTGASGPNWLFFGDQHAASDFLYREQILGWQRDGLLNRLDLAFSRDTDQKTYVQHLMEANSHDLFSWLQEGACLYVCGDANRMAKDVDETIHRIVAKEGGMSSDSASAYVAALRSAKRYVRDVY